MAEFKIIYDQHLTNLVHLMDFVRENILYKGSGVTKVSVEAGKEGVTLRFDMTHLGKSKTEAQNDEQTLS